MKKKARKKEVSVVAVVKALVVAVDTSGFSLPPGTPAQVDVTAGCRVHLADLLVPGLPGHWQLEGTSHHPMDTFRERTP